MPEKQLHSCSMCPFKPQSQQVNLSVSTLAGSIMQLCIMTITLLTLKITYPFTVQRQASIGQYIPSLNVIESAIDQHSHYNSPFDLKISPHARGAPAQRDVVVIVSTRFQIVTSPVFSIVLGNISVTPLQRKIGKPQESYPTSYLASSIGHRSLSQLTIPVISGTNLLWLFRVS